MEWIFALITLILAALVTVSAVLPICLTIFTFGFAIWAMVFWIQTVMLVLEREHGEDRTTWVLVVLLANFIGALIYRAMKPSPPKLRATANSWLASGRVASNAPRRTIQYSGRQVAVISVSSVIVGACLLCGGLVAFSVWYEPPITIITVTPAIGPTPFPTFPPLPFPTIDWTPG